MKKTIIFLSIIYCITLSGQTKEKYRKLPDVSGYSLISENDTIKPYCISQNPITNREYITYLCWLSDVYSEYPQILLNAFPSFQSKTIDSLMNERFKTTQINSLINYENLNILYYLFNPKFIDYPVIGITWNQAVNFCKWFSDRYNEAILIKKGYLRFDPNQKGSESFTTETYIANEYVGVYLKRKMNSNTKEERNVNWSDRILYPSFRLPSTYELRAAKGIIKSEFASYKQNKFLSSWSDYYVSVDKNKITLRIRYNKNVIIMLPPDIKSCEFKLTNDHSLDSRLSSKKANVFDIYKVYGQDFMEPKQPSKKFIKDIFGQMSYILIGEDVNSNPICIKKLEYDRIYNNHSDSIESNAIFRFAVNAVK